MSITIYGASDDLVEVEGDISEEFNPGDDGGVLAVSDGSAWRVQFTMDGVWRVTPLAQGTATVTKVEAVGPDDDNYSDRVTLDGDIRWVVWGERFEAARG